MNACKIKLGVDAAGIVFFTAVAIIYRIKYDLTVKELKKFSKGVSIQSDVVWFCNYVLNIMKNQSFYQSLELILERHKKISSYSITPTDRPLFDPAHSEQIFQLLKITC